MKSEKLNCESSLEICLCKLQNEFQKPLYFHEKSIEIRFVVYTSRLASSVWNPLANINSQK